MKLESLQQLKAQLLAAKPANPMLLPLRIGTFVRLFYPQDLWPSFPGPKLRPGLILDTGEDQSTKLRWASVVPSTTSTRLRGKNFFPLKDIDTGLAPKLNANGKIKHAKLVLDNALVLPFLPEFFAHGAELIGGMPDRHLDTLRAHFARGGVNKTPYRRALREEIYARKHKGKLYIEWQRVTMPGEIAKVEPCWKIAESKVQKYYDPAWRPLAV